ncbi:MAG: winged helix-turn-helix transcriptional regulator [Clostridia bacterium]|nr:winged helix-turn-helix transcriptional regulator [Clostridia bacterium]
MTEIEKNPLPTCEEHELHREKIEAGRRNMPPELELYRLADFFKVLGDSTRIKILFAIDGGALCVCDIAELVGMTKSAVSHQLKILRGADLVNYKKVGKNVFYELADDHVRHIIECALEHIRE